MCIRKCIHKSTRIENSTAVAAVVVVVFFRFLYFVFSPSFSVIVLPCCSFSAQFGPKHFIAPLQSPCRVFIFMQFVSGTKRQRVGGGWLLQERGPNGGNETMTIIITWQRAARRNHSLYLVPTVLTTRLSCALFLTHYLRTHTFSIYVCMCMCEWLACIATCETCEKATFSRSFLRRVAASIWRMQLVHLL